ncbi:hypothetical protein C922_03885 [Plasmodium inui San Antonio 1]|uniref:ATPase AAA-type core domain-containing protein n=1 Tax=Plasmodium inui San Antonio 1 TaxID=1237626 RepID=W7A935_9APIC|nr:hypothetical protein C922_03885 [Plasmodium inui San Antonio 1]EUD65639.1 hypothetical protein C922_03885 [Plasmodium inui San Antonio 1]
MKKRNNTHLLHHLVLLLRKKSPEDSKYVQSVDERSGFPRGSSIISGDDSIHGEKHATGKNDEEESPIIFLLTQMGKALLIQDGHCDDDKDDNNDDHCDDDKDDGDHDHSLNVRKKKKFISESHLVIQRDSNCVTIRSRNNLLYAVALLCGEREPKEGKTNERATHTATVTGRNNYTRVLSALKYASEKFEANLKYYVCLANGQCEMRKIHLLDCSQMVWDFQFFKDHLQRRIKYAQRSKSLCFVLSPQLLVREYALFVSRLIWRLGRSSRGAVFHVVEEGGTAASAAGDVVPDSVISEVVTHSSPGDVVDAPHFAPRDRPHLAGQQKTPFLQQIWSILFLLKEENTNLRSMYHLEDYTKMFIHNCDKLNRKSFLSFLKKIDHLHVHAVNLNTLFGLYFSETEENILKVFRKCERISKRTSRSVFLVIDGIDVVARRGGKGCDGCRDGGRDHAHDDARDGDGPGGEPNDNGRLLTTLLLCLDSVDSCTGRRRKAVSQRKHDDEGNGGHNLSKGDNPVTRVQKKKHSPEVDPYGEDSDHTETSSTDERTKKTLKKKKKLATHVTYDIKQLAKFYKEKHIELMRRKKEKYISIIVLSDLDLKQFDISLTRAGRFFHFIKYA